MGVAIAVRAVPGGRVVVLDGVIDAGLVPMIATGVEAVASHDGPVVIDIARLVVTNPAAVPELVRAATVGGVLPRVVCSRLTARRIVRRLVDAQVRLFSSVEAAVADLASPRLPPAAAS